MRLHHKPLLNLLLLTSLAWTPVLIPLHARQASASPPDRRPDARASRSVSKEADLPRGSYLDGLDEQDEQHDIPYYEDIDPQNDKLQKAVNNTLHGDQHELVKKIDEFTRVKLQSSYNIKEESQIELFHGPIRRVAIISQTHKGEHRRFRVYFDKKGDIRRVTYPNSIRERRDAWELIMKLIKATNNGSIEGQLACFADTVSPYYDHTSLTRSYIKQLLRRWKNRYSYYHMEELHTHVEESKNLMYDYDVHVKFRVTWKDVEGRRKHKQIFYALYNVSGLTIPPKIVAAQILRKTKAP